VLLTLIHAYLNDFCEQHYNKGTCGSWTSLGFS